MTQLKPETAIQRVQLAIYHLRQARELLKEAKAPKATAKVRLALTSTGGALRHAENEPYRAARRVARRSQTYLVTVGCDAVVPMEERHPIDQDEDPTGEQVYTIRAASPEEAAERALDEFHSTVPIKVLDDFEITTEVTP